MKDSSKWPVRISHHNFPKQRTKTKNQNEVPKPRTKTENQNKTENKNREPKPRTKTKNQSRKVFIEIRVLELGTWLCLGSR